MKEANAILSYIGVFVGGTFLAARLCWFLQTQNILPFNIDIWTVCALSLIIVGVGILVSVLWLRSVIAQ